MSLDTRFAGLFGDWPPRGPALPPDPTQGRIQGLLPAQPAAQPAMGLLEVPGDPSSLFGLPSFDPMPPVAGDQGPAGGPPLDTMGWLQALQALHDSLRAQSTSRALPRTPN
jgi:hypothetical protein